MTREHAAYLKPRQTVWWMLVPDLPPAVVLDLHPAQPYPLGYAPRGRYVRIGWPDGTVVNCWTDDLTLEAPAQYAAPIDQLVALADLNPPPATPAPVPPAGPPPPVVRNPAADIRAGWTFPRLFGKR